MSNINKAFWNERWRTNQTGWDIGYASPAIISYFEKIEDYSAKILIPGCGNAYEVSALLNLGFTDITILDVADEAVKRLKEKFNNQQHVKIICQNFF